MNSASSTAAAARRVVQRDDQPALADQQRHQRQPALRGGVGDLAQRVGLDRERRCRPAGSPSCVTAHLQVGARHHAHAHQQLAQRRAAVACCCASASSSCACVIMPSETSASPMRTIGIAPAGRWPRRAARATPPGASAGCRRSSGCAGSSAYRPPAPPAAAWRVRATSSSPMRAPAPSRIGGARHEHCGARRRPRRPAGTGTGHARSRRGRWSGRVSSPPPCQSMRNSLAVRWPSMSPCGSCGAPGRGAEWRGERERAELVEAQRQRGARRRDLHVRHRFLGHEEGQPAGWCTLSFRPTISQGSGSVCGVGAG